MGPMQPFRVGEVSRGPKKLKAYGPCHGLIQHWPRQKKEGWGRERTRFLLPPVWVGKERKGNVLFNDALNTFFNLRLYGVRHMVKDHSDSERETRCHHHMGYSFRLTARVLLYTPSHRQDNTYHSLCYTSRGALAGTRTVWVDAIQE